MKKFKVICRDLRGKKASLTLEAPNLIRLYQILDEKKLFLIKDPEVIEDDSFRYDTLERSNRRLSIRQKLFRKKPKFDSIIVSFKMLSTLIESGVNLTQALKDISSSLKDRELARIYDEVSKKLKSGQMFYQALAEFEYAFGHEVIETIRIGELTGELTSSLNILIRKLEKDLELKKKLKKQSIYPIFLISLVMIIFSVIVLYFIPRLMESYQMVLPANEIPPKTKTIMAINSFIVKNGPYLVISLFSIFVSWKLLRLFESGRRLRDRIVWRLPSIGMAVRFLNLAKASQTLHTGLAAGLTTMDCLRSIRRGATNYVFKREIERVIENVEGGLSLSQAVRSKNTDQLFVSLIRAGERSGKLSETMKNAMDYYFVEAQERLESALTLSTYFVIIFLGILVGYTIFSVIIPMYELPSVMNG